MRQFRCFLKRTELLILIVFCWAFDLHAQQDKSYAYIDSYVDQMSKNVYASPKALCEKLIKPDWNEKEKVRAIYYWIARNIDYDYEEYEAYKTGKSRQYISNKEIVLKAYKERKAICGEYAILFKYMADIVDIRTIVVRGYARNEIHQAGLAMNEISHAWNAVKIHGKWYLLDVTWASPSSRKMEINDYWFLINPKKMIVDHFPQEPIMQFLKEPVSKKEFDQYPFMNYRYYTFFKQRFPRKGKIVTSDSILSMKNPQLENGSCSFQMYDCQSKKWFTPKSEFLKAENKQQIYLEEKGEFLLRMDVHVETGAKSGYTYLGIIYFRIIRN